MNQHLLLRIGNEDDIDDLTELLNTCYRSKAGWTNEADIFAGERVSVATMQNLLREPQRYCFVFDNFGESDEAGALLGCIIVSLDLSQDTPTAIVEMAAVSPAVQQRGIGGEMLQAVETFAFEHLKQGRIQMSIVEGRQELIAHYQKRGYQLTGNSRLLNAADAYGEPIANRTQLIELQKELA
ncbi:MAG: GNAT family N-acetyltransferase [Neisseria sp.]|nr:GNAT family N-acetyltransferase [Neisseria sp.]